VNRVHGDSVNKRVGRDEMAKQVQVNEYQHNLVTRQVR